MHTYVRIQMDRKIGSTITWFDDDGMVVEQSQQGLLLISIE